MKHFTLLLLVAILCVGSTHAQRTRQRGARQNERVVKVDSVLIAPFRAFEWTTDNKTVKYRAAVTTGKPGEAPALVVYLHGKSASGDDNLRQMSNRGIYSIFDYLKDNHIHAVMIVPQCPADYTWSGGKDRKGQNESEGYNRYVKKLIDSCVASMGIDSTRIYVLGASMGGGGVWHLISDYPDTFAAAFSASGNSRGCDMDSLVRTPVYSTLGTGEGEKNLASFRQHVETLNDKGGEAKFDSLEGLKHPQACVAAFTPERLQWVFSHKKTAR